MASPARAQRQMHRLQRLLQQGRRQQARHGLQRLLARHRRHPRANFELGLLSESEPDQALKYYTRSVHVDQRQADVWFRIGLIYEQRYAFLKATMAFGTALQIQGGTGSASLYLHMAQALTQIHFEQAALEFYLKTIEIDPDNPSAFFLLSQALLKLGDLDLSLDALMTLGKLYPSRLDLISLMMGNQLERQGEIDAARQCYAEAVSRRPHQWLWQLKRDVAYPLVPISRELIETAAAEIETALKRALARLQQLPPQMPQEQFLTLGMLHGNIAYTAYHHLPVLKQRQLLAEVIGRALPRPLAWQPQPSGGRIHLGILVVPKSISLSYTYAGAMARQLDPERFDVTVFCMSPDIIHDYTPDGRLHFSGRHIRRQLVSGDPFEAVQQMRAARLDALYLTEPGWDFHQFVCGLLRAAPIQFTSWMNPGSSGLPTMDYYLSSTWIEPEGAEAEYSESLEKWPVFPSWVPAMHLPRPAPRADFGLEEDWHLYGCLQNLLKFHPDFDEVIAGILRKDPKGQLLMVTPDARSRLASKLMKRFEARIPDVMDRIWVFPELDNVAFLQLLGLCDLALDPIYYGSGTTAYQALNAGLPLITLPGERMVGRISAGLSLSLGIADGIVGSLEEYIERAVELANDSARREDIRRRTMAVAPQLFEDPRSVACLSAFLMRVTKKN